MGTGIDGPPNQYDAGLEFDYSVWTPGTTVDLVNVTWNNDYRDVFMPDTREEIDAYINSLPKMTLEHLSYAKPNEDIYLNVPFNKVARYNYIRASNPLMPIPDDIQKNYYYFIIGCEYVSPMNTRLRLQLDVWATYIHDVTFGNCYVERGHAGIANENAMRNYGRDYLTVPEGLDIGSELLVTKRYAHTIISDDVIIGAMPICIASTVDLTADPGTAEAPKLNSAKGGYAFGVVSGCDIYLFENVGSFSEYMLSISDKPWVSQGIISVTAIPNRYADLVSAWNPSGTPTRAPSDIPISKKQEHITLKENWREEVIEWIPERYRHLKKMLVSPYLQVELSTMQGNAIALKPEVWQNADLEVAEVSNPIPPNQKVSVFPRGYNAYAVSVTEAPFSDEETAVATHMANLPTFSIVNNMAISFMASNRNSILYGQTSADWSQQRALAMAGGAYSVAGGAMSTAQDLAAIGINADIAQTGIGNRLAASQGIINSVGQFVSGAGNALTPGGFGGAAISGISQAAVGGANTALQIGANDQSLAVRNSQATETVNRQNQQAGLARDTNYELAQFAARGDYANAMAAVNARVQDAKMIQPTISGQAGGDLLNLLNGWLEVRATIKRIDYSATTIVGEYWLRYGYAIRKFIKPPVNLRVMTKFTYWKMLETYISASNVPEGHKQVLRGILEKGVTTWVNPNDIGVIDIADNDVIGGFAY